MSFSIVTRATRALFSFALTVSFKVDDLADAVARGIEAAGDLFYRAGLELHAQVLRLDAKLADKAILVAQEKARAANVRVRQAEIARDAAIDQRAATEAGQGIRRNAAVSELTGLGKTYLTA